MKPKQTHSVSTPVPVFPDRTGIEETVSAQGAEVCSAPVPGVYKPGGCWVLLSSGGQYPARCICVGTEIGDDRSEKETWSWRAAEERRGTRAAAVGDSGKVEGRDEKLRTEWKETQRMKQFYTGTNTIWMSLTAQRVSSHQSSTFRF